MMTEADEVIHLCDRVERAAMARKWTPDVPWHLYIAELTSIAHRLESYEVTS